MRETEFTRYGLSEEVLTALKLLGYVEPTRIQELVIPLALEDRDIAAASATGTGKTAAFAVPVCEKVSWDGNEPQALVLEPTRELAVQVREELFHIGRRKRLNVPAVFGGFPIDKQIQTLKQKCHIVVGTPGRVLDHIKRGTMSVSRIAVLVIDEADLMLDMGFLDEVGQIIEAIPGKPQMMLFSATMKDRIGELTERYMAEPVQISVEAESLAAESVKQAVCEVSADEKYEAFLSVLMHEKPKDAMIFCGTRDMVNVLCRKLRKDQVRAGLLHGEMDQAERLKTVEDMRSGRIHFLIATDVAARGVDLEGITHVFNYDFPTAKETYVHRIGRTGRNGKTGKAVSFVTPEEKKHLQAVETYIEKEIPKTEWKPLTDEIRNAFLEDQKHNINERVRKGSELKRSIMRLSIGGGKKSKIRTVDVVGTICSIPGICAEDIGTIDIRESLTYVEIMNHKGMIVLDALQTKPLKGKVRKVRKTKAE